MVLTNPLAVENHRISGIHTDPGDVPFLPISVPHNDSLITNLNHRDQVPILQSSWQRVANHGMDPTVLPDVGKFLKHLFM